MANPINTRNFNNIYNALTADKLRNFLSQIDPTDFATLDKDFKNLLNARARTMSGSMTDPQTLMQLAQYGGRQGALPGAGLGAALGFVTAPGTESENIVGAKSYKAPTIGDRLMNALTYGAGGAAIGAGAGAFNMRQLAKQLSGKNAPPEVMEAFLSQAKLGPEVEKLVANAHSVATKGGKNLNPTSVFRDEGDLVGLLSRLQSSLAADDASKSVFSRWWSGDDYNTHIKRQILAGLMGRDVSALADPAIAKEFNAAAARLYPMLNENTAKTLKSVSEGALAKRFKAPTDLIDDTVDGANQLAGLGVGGSLGAILGTLAGGAGSVAGPAGTLAGATAGAYMGGKLPGWWNRLRGAHILSADAAAQGAMKSGDRNAMESLFGKMDMNLSPGFGQKEADKLRADLFKMKELYDRKIFQPIGGEATRGMLKKQMLSDNRLRAAGLMGLGTAGVAGIGGAAYGMDRLMNNRSAANPDNDPNTEQLQPTPTLTPTQNPRPRPAPIQAAPVMSPMAPVMSPPMHTAPRMDFIDPDIINNMGNMHKAGAAKVRPSSAIVSAITGLARTK